MMFDIIIIASGVIALYIVGITIYDGLRNKE